MSINWETTKAWVRRVLQGTGLLAVAAAVAYWYLAAVPVREHRVETGEVVASMTKVCNGWARDLEPLGGPKSLPLNWPTFWLPDWPFFGLPFPSKAVRLRIWPVNRIQTFIRTQSMAKCIWHVRNGSLFEKLSNDQLASLEGGARTKSFAKGTTIYFPQDEADAVLLCRAHFASLKNQTARLDRNYFLEAICANVQTFFGSVR